MPDGKRLFFFCQFYHLISAFVALLSVKLFLAVWGENVTFFYSANQAECLSWRN